MLSLACSVGSNLPLPAWQLQLTLRFLLPSSPRVQTISSLLTLSTKHISSVPMLPLFISLQKMRYIALNFHIFVTAPRNIITTATTMITTPSTANITFRSSSFISGQVRGSTPLIRHLFQLGLRKLILQASADIRHPSCTHASRFNIGHSKLLCVGWR